MLRSGSDEALGRTSDRPLRLLAASTLTAAAGLLLLLAQGAAGSSMDTSLTSPELFPAGSLLGSPPGDGDATAGERAESRTAFAALSDAEAIAVTGEEHPDVIVRRAIQPLDLPAGAEVVDFTSPTTALVDVPGTPSHTLVESTLPLRAESETGALEPVDLSLQREAGGIEPENPLIPVTIPDQATEMSSLEPAGVGFKLADAEPGSDASLVGETVHYPNARTDTDYLVRLIPSGAAVQFQLRSQDSPERLELAFDLPAGAQLDGASGGAQPTAATVAADGEKLVSITEPVAWDADGEPVPVRASVEGEALAIEIEHRGRDLRYPILVDPEFLDHHYALPYRNGDGTPTGWSERSGSFPNAYSAGNKIDNYASNDGWLVSNAWENYYGDYGYYQDGEWGGWSYRSPGTQSYIYRADTYTNWSHPNGSYLYQGIATPYVGWDAGGTSTGAWPLSPVITADPIGGVTLQHFISQPRENNEFWTYMQASGEGWRWRLWYGTQWMFSLNGASFWLGDRIAPQIRAPVDGHATTEPDDTTPPTYEHLPTGWVDDVEIQSDPEAVDEGFGIKYYDLEYPVESEDGAVTQRRKLLTVPCTGAVNDRCEQGYWLPASDPDGAGEPFAYSTAEMPEGVNTVRARAADFADNWTPAETWEVKVDRTFPDADLAGSLTTSGEHYLRAPEELVVTATDPPASGSGPSSGVRSIEVSVDGTPLGSPLTDPCPASQCPPALSRTVAFDPAAYADGTHTISVSVSDGAGHASTVPLSGIETCAHATEAECLTRVADPDAVAPSEPVETTDGQVLEPSVTPDPVPDPEPTTSAPDYLATSTGVEAEIPERLSDGATIELPDADDPQVTGDSGTLTVKPTGTAGADPGVPATTDDSVVFGDTGAAEHMVLRPTPDGIETFTTLAGPAASTSQEFEAGLEGAETVRETAAGGVVILDPTPDVSITEDAVEPRPAEEPATANDLADFKAEGEVAEDVTLAEPEVQIAPDVQVPAAIVAAADAAGTKEEVPQDADPEGVDAPPVEGLDPLTGETAPGFEDEPSDAPPDPTETELEQEAQAADLAATGEAKGELTTTVAQEDDQAEDELSDARDQEELRELTAPLVVAEIEPPTSVDASGQELPTTLDVIEHTDGSEMVTLTVDTQGATFPVVADPKVKAKKAEVHWQPAPKLENQHKVAAHRPQFRDAGNARTKALYERTPPQNRRDLGGVSAKWKGWHEVKVAGTRLAITKKGYGPVKALTWKPKHKKTKVLKKIRQAPRVLSRPAVTVIPPPPTCSSSGNPYRTEFTLTHTIPLSTVVPHLSSSGFLTDSLEHAAPNTGGLFVGGENLDGVIASYRDMTLEEFGVEPQIEKFTLLGQVPASALGSLANEVAERIEYCQPADNEPEVVADEEPVSPDGLEDFFYGRDSQGQPDDEIDTARSHGKKFAPGRGWVRTLPTSPRRTITSTLTWGSAAALRTFDREVGHDYPYEHEFRLYAKHEDQVGGTHPGCPHRFDRFWAVHETYGSVVLAWETSFPSDAEDYLDTQRLNSCNTEEFSIGVENPTKLKPDLRYRINIYAPEGHRDGGAYYASGSKVNYPPIGCIGPASACATGTISTQPFVGKTKGNVKDLCRYWRKGRPSQIMSQLACSP